MMFELDKFDSIIPENEVENKKSLESLDRSLMQQYKLSLLSSSSNSTSNLLLEKIWEDHTNRVDDHTSKGIDNFSGPIGILLPHKNIIRGTKTWTSSLRDFQNMKDILHKHKSHCNETQCTDTEHIDQNDLFSFIFNKYSNENVKTDYKTDQKFQLTYDKEVDTCLTDKPNLFKPKISQENSLMEEPSTSKHFGAQHNTNFKENNPVLNKKYSGINQNHTGSRQSTSRYDQNNAEFNQNNLRCNQNSSGFNRVSQNSGFNLNKLDCNTNKDRNDPPSKVVFKSAREQLALTNPAMKKSLGTARKGQNKFVSPLMTAENKEETKDEPVITDDRLKHIDPKMVELIQSEIIDNSQPIGWEEIAGLEMAKSVIQEAVVWPLLRPDIFTGLRRPPKGILLFGPPGTGKTLIGKCVASQCKATFFNISASSLTSKWIGDGEKMVRALFAVARCHQPAVIFIDEIDSLLTQRSDAEHEATRRIKTEFLVQFDGAGTGDEDRLLIIGATNRPQELDEAARRRLVKRLYIPLPENSARKQIIENLLLNERNTLQVSEIERVSELTEGFSGADMRSLCSEAAMGPIRSVPMSQIVNIQTEKVRPVVFQDFLNALERVRPSVSQDDLGQYVKWNKTYGLGY